MKLLKRKVKMSFTCEFCDKSFVNKGNLNLHQKRAKYCLSKRGVEVVTKLEFKCTYCDKLFSSKQMCELHETKCNCRSLHQIETDHKKELDQKNNIISLRDQEITFLHQQLKEKNQEIESYKQKLENIALEGLRKPTTSTTNTSNNITNILTPLDLSQDTIQKIVENKLNETYFLEAQKGVAKFCFDNLIKTDDGKRRLLCSDPVRERYRYLDDKGNVREDIQAREFIEKVSKPIIEASKKIHDDIKDKYAQKKEDIKSGIKKDDDSVYIVEIKEKYAEQCLKDIHDIPFESTNKKFRKELALKSNI